LSGRGLRYTTGYAEAAGYATGYVTGYVTAPTGYATGYVTDYATGYVTGYAGEAAEATTLPTRRPPGPASGYRGQRSRGVVGSCARVGVGARRTAEV
jgi:hypothetical protein